MLCLLDIETTGLQDHDEMLELAMVLVDDDLVLVNNAQFQVVIRTTIDAKLRMSKDVMDMHISNNLFADEKLLGVGLNTAYELAYHFISDYVKRGTLLCGNSIHFDRRFLRKYMPMIDQHFHYRNLDISSIRECCRLWLPSLDESKLKPQKKHRALNDIFDSLELLRFYRSNLFEKVGK